MTQDTGPFLGSAKRALADAKRALADGVLETVVDGDVQATKSYLQGDFIVSGAATAHHPFKYHPSSGEFAVSPPTTSIQPVKDRSNQFIPAENRRAFGSNTLPRQAATNWGFR